MKTKQLETVKKLQPIEEIYRSMIGRISDGFVSIDNEGFYTYVNNQAGKFYNRNPVTLLGKNIWKEFPELLTLPFHKAYQQAFIKKEYVYLEVHEPSAARWLGNHFYPSADGISILITDITKRRKKEIAADKLAKRNAWIMEIMQNSFLLTDINLNVVDVNDAFCKSLGYTRQEMLTMNVKDFDVFFSADEFKNNLKIAAKESSIQFETKNKKRNGDVISVAISLVKMELDGETFFASFGSDISESKKAKEQIINEKKLSDSIINSLPGIFYVFDSNGKFLRWNKNLEIVSKYNSEEVASMHPINFFDTDEQELLTQKIQSVFIEGSAEVEAHFFTKDKKRIPFYFNGQLAHIEGKPCLLGMGIDISERKKAEKTFRLMETEISDQKVQEQKKITRAILKAQETERNYIGGELHDNVNQILAGTKLYLVLAGKQDARIKKLIKYPMKLIDSCINEIRLLTSKNVTPVRNINLKRLIATLVNNINKTTSVKTQLTYKVVDDNIDDELKLNIYRIVQEQLTNITKHGNCTEASISIEGYVAKIELIISDNGKGFDVDKKREGIGITNMINRVESFNGTIEIESSAGKGSIFKIEIPFDLQK